MTNNSIDTMLNIVFDDIRVLKHKTQEIETSINMLTNDIHKIREYLTLEFENLKKEQYNSFTLV